MSTDQQVMSPTDLADFSSFIEEKPAQVKKEPKAEPNEKTSREEQRTTVTKQYLERLAARLELLESRDKSRQETVEAKKYASQIFKKWDVDVDMDLNRGNKLNLNDLSEDRPRRAQEMETPYPQPPYKPVPPPQHFQQQDNAYGIPSSK